MSLVPATARANIEIGGTAGVHVFSTLNELGVPDVPNAASERNSALFGLRIGVMFNDWLGIEGEFGVIPSEARQMVFDVWNLAYRAHIIAQWGADDPNRKLVPFALIGGGAMTVVSSGNENIISKDTDAESYAGIGAKYRVENGWGLRADARILFPPSSADNGVTVDYEILLSIYREFGRKPPTKTEEKKGPKDSDGDGIPDDVDKCPNAAEDKDGFQDEDGCPDPDNDGDGIADGADKCPLEAEDHDGYQDEDGCPEPDNDGDAIPDAVDHCPNEAEDKDGFQDEDGCPDPDNDGDGIPDGQDKCPTQQETKNGYQDEDGCPDEVPAKIKKFTGVIQGINFKVNSAELLPNSNKVLDQAIAVMKEFPEMKLEIQGHTDDQPIAKGGTFADNQALSQARAESVAAYFTKNGIDQSRITAKGYGDSAPVENPKDLKGGKLNAARAKNRRVEFKLISGASTTVPPEGGGAPAPAPAAAPDKKATPEKAPAPEKKAAPDKTPEKKEEKKAPEKAPEKKEEKKAPAAPLPQPPG
jgi:outer membrane protein OmpA-like peptidoglycan-associated protein